MSSTPTDTTRDMVQVAAKVLDYTFKDELLLKEALTHASSAVHRVESNERMEFLGDAILNYVVCEYLFREYPKMLEGEMTKIKSEVVSRQICAKVSEKIDLGSMLMLGKGISSRPSLPRSISAAVLESVIAAIYLDGGIRPARKFILKQMVSFIRESDASAHQQNFKSVLQQHAQKNLDHPPVYFYLDEKGPDHSKCFEVCVEIEGRRFPSAWAASKKEAEQKAALEALSGLELVTIDEEGQVHLCEPLATKSGSRRSNRSRQGSRTESGDTPES